MKKVYFTIASISFIFLQVVSNSCSETKEQPMAYFERFYRDREKLEELVKMLKTDSSLEDKYGEVFKPSNFDNTTRQKLNNLGIDEICIFSWGGNQRQFDFKTNWKHNVPVHLSYNTLDSIETVKGFYRKDENKNEIWGLGEHWIIWIERKLIDAIQ